MLDDLGLCVPHADRVGDMTFVGPAGGGARLPAIPRACHPGYALAVPRLTLDAFLHGAALDAGAEPFKGRATAIYEDDGTVSGCQLPGGHEIRAEVVIGADGALSGMAEAAGLLDPLSSLWGFAIRAYVDQPLDLPTIVVWEPSPWAAFPGYGWVFPGAGGRANVGLGIGAVGDRSAGVRPAREFEAFLDHLAALGLLALPRAKRPRERLGGWLKMGMVGTTPARGRVLLVGDAAGLVNPLQGEGISQALESGRAAAEAVLKGPSGAAARYRAYLRSTTTPFCSTTAAVQSTILPRPGLIAAIARGFSPFPASAGRWRGVGRCTGTTCWTAPGPGCLGQSPPQPTASGAW